MTVENLLNKCLECAACTKGSPSENILQLRNHDHVTRCVQCNRAQWIGRGGGLYLKPLWCLLLFTFLGVGGGGMYCDKYFQEQRAACFFNEQLFDDRLLFLLLDNYVRSFAVLAYWNSLGVFYLSQLCYQEYTGNIVCCVKSSAFNVLIFQILLVTSTFFASDLCCVRSLQYETEFIKKKYILVVYVVTQLRFAISLISFRFVLDLYSQIKRVSDVSLYYSVYVILVCALSPVNHKGLHQGWGRLS